MYNYKIDFEKMDWESPVPGVRHKVYMMGDQKVRLVEFSEEHEEDGWCTRGHVGYIIEGRISIDFNGMQVTFKKGDGLHIREGESDKHRATVSRGEKTLIVMFEKA